MERDLMILGAADPDLAAESADAAEDARLAALRRRVDAARRTAGHGRQTRAWAPSRPVHGRRRFLVTVVAPAAVATALAVAVPLGISVLAPGSSVDRALTPDAVAIGPTGDISCASGDSRAIDPADSPLRHLPADREWSVSYVSAAQETTTGYCGGPSLVVRESDGETVTGQLTVSGPFVGVIDDAGGDPVVAAPGAEEREDRVDGHVARQFQVFEDLHRWLWQDEEGRSWLAEVDGYDSVRARSLVAGISVTGDQVHWASSTSPDAVVVHRRTGDPYPVTRTEDVWHVTLTNGDRSVSVRVADDPDGVRVPITVQGEAGYRVTTVAGLPAIVDSGIGEAVEPGVQTDTPPGEEWAWAAVELAPGVVASGGWTGDADGLLRLLASLEQVAADDDRLDPYTGLRRFVPSDD